MAEAKQLSIHLDSVLTPLQLRTLFEIAMGTVPSFRHDISNSLGAIRAYVNLLGDSFQEQTSSADRVEYLSRITTAVERSYKILGLGLGYPVELASDATFISDPLVLVSEIITHHANKNIDLAADSAKNIQLIYPTTSLFSLLYGLITNSINHSKKPSPRIEIDWAVEEEIFTCNINDDGPGIPLTPTDKFVHADALPLQPTDRSVDTGIQLLSRLLRRSRGRLLFRRSLKLGGTHAQIILPMPGVIIDGQLRHFASVYAHE